MKIGKVYAKVEDELTHAAFLAVVIYALKHSRGQWYWLCLSEEAQEEMLDEAQAEFLKWRNKELETERRRADLSGRKVKRVT